MDAIQILEQDHKTARKVMDEIHQIQGVKKKALFMALKADLEMHDRIEENIFYPSVQSHVKGGGITEVDKSAHVAIEKILGQLADLSIEDPRWARDFALMQTKLIDHIVVEETLLFVKIREILSTTELLDLGHRISREKERLLAIA